jgi:hypothetical protein
MQMIGKNDDRINDKGSFGTRFTECSAQQCHVIDQRR